MGGGAVSGGGKGASGEGGGGGVLRQRNLRARGGREDGWCIKRGRVGKRRWREGCARKGA